MQSGDYLIINFAKNNIFLSLRLILTVFVTLLIFSCKNEKSAEKAELSVNSDQKSVVKNENEIKVVSYSFNEFEKLLYEEDDKIHIINFWATWCKPCIEELPSFQKIRKEYAHKGVELTLVSLDFPKQLETRLVPYIKEHNIEAEVVLLDDPKGNDWIPKVDSTWSGAIPATLIYDANHRKFYERSFSYDELKQEVEGFVN